MSNDEAKEPEVIASTLEETTLAVREPTPGELIRQAVTAGATPEVLQTLADLYERFKAGAAREAFVTALSEFQSKCPIIEKTKKVYGKNGKLRYCYAPLDVIVRQVRHILHECGLSYTIDDEFKDGMMYATCKVTHVLGHSETSTFMAPIDKDAYMNEPQKYASANTYAKRYAFCNGTGILTGDEDDDARSVGATAEEEPAPVTTAPDVPQPGEFTHDHEPPEREREPGEDDEPPPHEDPDEGAGQPPANAPSTKQVKFFQKLEADLIDEVGAEQAVETLTAIQKERGLPVTCAPKNVYEKRQMSKLIDGLLAALGRG